MTKEIVRLGGILCAITLIVTLALTLVNSATFDIIAQNTIEAENRARQELVACDSFTEVYENVFEGKNGNEIKGYCVSVSPSGYGGAIGMIVGVSVDGTVSGIKIVEHSETPGLGARAGEDDFVSQFENKSAPLAVVKAGAADGEINAISGATVTSNAVVSGVNEAVDLLKSQGFIK